MQKDEKVCLLTKKKPKRGNKWRARGKEKEVVKHKEGERRKAEEKVRNES